MATKVMKTETSADVPVPINADPDVQAATAALAAVHQRYTAASTRARRYEYLISPPADVDIDALDRLEAQANYPDARHDVIRLEAERTMAERAVVIAREAARQRLADSFRPLERAAIATLRSRLLAAAEANDVLRGIQFQKHEMTGQPFEALAWFELSDGPDGRLAQWRSKVQEYGLE